LGDNVKSFRTYLEAFQMREHNENHSYTEEIKSKIKNLGANCVGVADTEALKGLRLNPPNLLDSFPRAVSIALRLPSAAFEQIIDQPTPLYFSIYQTANGILDDIAFHATNIIQRDGFKSLPIPASQVLDREHWYGAITHKAVGRMAGLGWQGKSLLLVNPDYGPRIRLATVLTDAPLNVDSPIKNRCAECTLCKDACPAEAIKGVGTKDNYKNRDEALYFSRCVEKLVGEFSTLPNVGAPICGICIKVCPFGR
jgi:epoxyqueuosine reductase